jgi:hypothetical protein
MPDRELRRVIDRASARVPVGRAVAKADFEAIHAEILACVREKTGASDERLGEVAPRVLAALPAEYGRLPERDRSWPALIAYLYAKYLAELGAGRDPARPAE